MWFVYNISIIRPGQGLIGLGPNIRSGLGLEIIVMDWTIKFVLDQGLKFQILCTKNHKDHLCNFSNFKGKICQSPK